MVESQRYVFVMVRFRFLGLRLVTSLNYEPEEKTVNQPKPPKAVR